MKLKLGATATLLLATLTLTACGGAPSTDNTSAETELSTDALVEITDQQGSIDGYVGAVEDAEVLRCEANNDGWLSEGTVTNPEDKIQDYRLYVAFNQNRDTRALVQVDLKAVGPGETAEWETSAAIASDEIECMLRVERFDTQ